MNILEAFDEENLTLFKQTLDWQKIIFLFSTTNEKLTTDIWETPETNKNVFHPPFWAIYLL